MSRIDSRIFLAMAVNMIISWPLFAYGIAELSAWHQLITFGLNHHTNYSRVLTKMSFSIADEIHE
jgi:hypothetical protein